MKPAFAEVVQGMSGGACGELVGSLWGACGELVGTDPVCDAENLRRIGDVFERYGSFGEEDALVGVGGC